MVKIYDNMQVSSNMKRYELKVEDESGRDYITVTRIEPILIQAQSICTGRVEKQSRGSAKVKEVIYLDDFVQPSPVFKNEYFGQHNTLAEAGYLITLTEDFEAILYNFCPVPHKPVGVKVSSKQLRVMGRAK